MEKGRGLLRGGAAIALQNRCATVERIVAASIIAKTLADADGRTTAERHISSRSVRATAHPALWQKGLWIFQAARVAVNEGQPLEAHA
jgi:hypothetical protein